MQPQTALQALDETVAQVKMTREDHFTAMSAVETLQRTIHEARDLREELEAKNAPSPVKDAGAGDQAGEDAAAASTAKKK